MNPFDTSKNFNSHLYECISKLNKTSERMIIQGFEELISIDDDSISGNNVVIRGIMKKHFLSNNPEIKRLCSKLLLKVLKHGLDNLTEVLSIWFTKFIEDPSYDIDKLIYKDYFHIDLIYDYLLKTLNWEDDIVGSIKIYCSMLSRNKNIYALKEKNYFVSKKDFLKFNSSIVLKYIYVVMYYIGPIDELYDNIESIKVSVLVSIKWKILLEIYDRIPACIIRDANYIENTLLEKIIAKVKQEKIVKLEDIVVKKMDKFFIILKYCDNKGCFFKANKKHLDLKCVCVFRIVDNFELIDETNKDTNDLIINTVNKHKLNSQELEELNCILKDKEIFVDACMEVGKCEQCECGNSNIDVYVKLLETFKYLSEYEQISRAYTLKLNLNGSYFDENVINSSQWSVFVFHKKYLAGHKNTVAYICKYPEDYDLDYVADILSEHNVRDFVKVPKFTPKIKQWLKTQDLQYCIKIGLLRNFPKEYDLLFFCHRVCDNLDYIDYDELLTEYMSHLDDIKRLYIFKKELFNKAVIKKLQDLQVPISLEYNDEYYSDIPYFYKNIEYVSTSNKFLEILTNYYYNDINSDLEMILYMTCTVILNKFNGGFSPNKIVLIDLKTNNYFLYRVYSFLHAGFDEPFERNKNIIDLIEGRLDTLEVEIDKDVRERKSIENNTFILDSKNAKVLDERVIRNIYSDVYNATSLSNKAIRLIANSIVKEFDVHKAIEYLENDKFLDVEECFITRIEIYSEVINLITDYFSNSFLNNFSLAKTEKGVDDYTLLDFLISGMPKNPKLFIVIFIDALMKIRNLNLVFFFSKC